MRRALEYAAGREEISEKVYGGLQEPAGSYFSWRVPGTDVGIAPYGQDLEEAGRILEEAGWIYAEGESIRSKNGQRLELRLVYDDSIAGNGQVGELLKAQYEAAGFPRRERPMRKAGSRASSTFCFPGPGGSPMNPMAAFSVWRLRGISSIWYRAE